jgi:tetratricopeptide (TPR) repeat protein
MRAARGYAILACLAISAGARDAPGWRRLTTPHFEIYSNADPGASRFLAVGLERLHAFFLRQFGTGPPAPREVRVIYFASSQEYGQYRARPGADAFFVGVDSRDYIVLPAMPRGELRVAAHEYAHVLIHSGGWTLPEWIAEGIGDVVSTLQIGERDTRVGGDLPDRIQTLQRGAWMTFPELFSFTLKNPPARADRENMFYAQSWALADLLMLSPAYRPAFPALLASLASGVPAELALYAAYRTPLDAIARDLHTRAARSTVPLLLPALAEKAPDPQIEDLTPFDSRAMLADLRLANGDLAAAESAFRDLAAERPASARVQADLGAIVLKRGDTAGAIAFWQRALELGITDADLCYRYAMLADSRGLPVRTALERAIALRPDFDDARFKLALLEQNAGHAEAAVLQLRAMRRVTPARAFVWWTALAGALLDLDRRAEAKQAAAEAHTHAASDTERARATQLAWLADTEMVVEIEGAAFHMVRVPVNAASRNPFIEAGDRAQSTEATMREVQCLDDGIRLVVQTPQGPLTLTVADPSRVQIRNAGSVAFEFVCGPQDPRNVLIEYAPATSIVRGLEFR